MKIEIRRESYKAETPFTQKIVLSGSVLSSSRKLNIILLLKNFSVSIS